MSTVEAARKYLKIMKKPQSARHIAEALKNGGMHSTAKDLVNNVNAILHRATEEFMRVNREWGLSEWYPGAKKGKRNQQKYDSDQVNGNGEKEV